VLDAYKFLIYIYCLTDEMARALRNIVVDPRLRMFDPEISTNIQSSASFKSFVKNKYHYKCVLCGADQHLTVAHLIVNNDQEDYSVFQPPRYRTYFDPECIRNRIVLCGTKTEVGTCHNLFDFHHITIYYNAMTKKYNAICVRENPQDLRFRTGDIWELRLPKGLTADELPYKRILAWRMRKCALTHASSLSADQLNNFATMADLSEAEEVGDGLERTYSSDTLSTDSRKSFKNRNAGSSRSYSARSRSVSRSAIDELNEND
jgi:hypothetical protein